MKKVIVLSRVSTEGQDLTQQTDEVLREVYKDGYTDSNIIIIEDKESAIQLSEEERHGLNKMKEYISTNPKRREHGVFSCFTGLAYCDAQALTSEHIINGPNNCPWIRTHRKKTSTPVDVPLLDVPLQILAKYEDSRRGDRLLQIPANQKCNDYLKEIAAICGIEKRLTFHLARHSYLSLLLKTNDLQNLNL